MSVDLLKGMKPEDLAMHLRTALGTPSGKVLWQHLRRQCFMDPDPQVNPRKWESPEQVVARYSRITLFQDMEYLLKLQPKEKS